MQEFTKIICVHWLKLREFMFLIWTIEELGISGIMFPVILIRGRANNFCLTFSFLFFNVDGFLFLSFLILINWSSFLIHIICMSHCVAPLMKCGNEIHYKCVYILYIWEMCNQDSLYFIWSWELLNEIQAYLLPSILTLQSSQFKLLSPL